MKSSAVPAAVPVEKCRSREGAWIEILANRPYLIKRFSRSREGAWIEITKSRNCRKRNWRRSREGAWIEIEYCRASEINTHNVAPVRERGLK